MRRLFKYCPPAKSLTAELRSEFQEDAEVLWAGSDSQFPHAKPAENHGSICHFRKRDYLLSVFWANTTPQSGKTVYFRVVSGPNSSSTVINGTTAADGTVQLSYSAPNGNGEDLIRVWYNPAVARSTWKEYEDAWSEISMKLGTVVTVEASPDVANDKSNATQKGKFIFTKTGSTTATLAVTVSLPTTGSAPATYGASGSSDYSLTASTPTTWAYNSALPNPGTVTFGAGQSQAVLEVLPVFDNLTENNQIYLTVIPGASYGVGFRDKAQVSIYDGPI